MRMRSAWILGLMLIVSACTGNGNGASPGTNGNEATTPVAAVEELRSMLIAGDFVSAGALAVPNQAALASLGEGASFGQVADAITDGDAEIAANFWSGFGQGVGEVLNSELAIEDRGSITESGVEFFLVGVTPAQGTERLIMTRDVDGQRIDLFASFGAGLAQRMLSPVEILLGTSSADSAVILDALQDVVPSLLVSATDPSLSPEAVQGVLQLVELITRVG